ncbi:MAG: hypothetical protein IT437_03495 [Phycisphaerales bacterium]|nr:hypothetical protein [Phycisphaerales bacterium]
MRHVWMVGCASVEQMVAAHVLYRALGFRRIDRYGGDPLPWTADPGNSAAHRAIR